MTPPKAPLLDTNMVVHAVRKTPLFQQADRDYWLTSRADAAIISIVTVGEMLALALKWNWGDANTEKLRERLAQLSVVGIESPAILDHYAEIDHHCEQNGLKLGKNDLWIAATASVLEVLLLTTDKDFTRLPETLLRHKWYDPKGIY